MKGGIARPSSLLLRQTLLAAMSLLWYHPVLHSLSHSGHCVYEQLHVFVLP